MSDIRIIDFYADWCIPCKQYDVILPQLTEELEFELEKVNVEFNEDMVEEYQVNGLPTLVIVEDDTMLGKIEGASSKEKLLEKLTNILGTKMLGDHSPRKWEDQPKEQFIR